MIRRERLPANLTQAQRDFFGAHTYKRLDRDGDIHTDWSRLAGPTRPRDRTRCARACPRSAPSARPRSSSSAPRATSPSASWCPPSTTSRSSRLLPGGFAMVGVARRPKPELRRRDAGERRQVLARASPLNEAHLERARQGHLATCRASSTIPETYTKLKAELERLDKERGTQQNRVFYLSVGPDQVATIVEGPARVAASSSPPSDDAGRALPARRRREALRRRPRQRHAR